MHHFHKRFSAPPGCPIIEIMEVLNIFPKLIIDEMKQDLMKEVTEEELAKILASFQKGKIPSPDGFTVEFFLGFYDLIKDDLLKVVKESQKSGKVLGALNSTFISLFSKKKGGSGT